MSTAPRPQSSPFLTSPEKRCTAQAAGPAGTTSRRPRSSSASGALARARRPGYRVRTAGSGLQYLRLQAIAHVPHPGCATTEAISGVGQPAALTISSGLSHGIGAFTATCAGATSVAGLAQKSPVSVQYAVSYGFGGFISPRLGSTIAKSSRSLTVSFRLLTASGAPISAATAKALAWAHHVRAELTGPGIKAAIGWCSWRAAAKALACTIRIPVNAHRGSGYRYYLTVQESAGTGWHTAPVARKIANPEVIHFR